MKTLAKTLFMTLVAAAATGVIAADMTSKLVTFSSVGDKYADGTPVLDGEFYALCWSPSSTFGGMNANLAPLREGDEVLRVASLAKGGKCPPVVFVLDGAKAHSDGYYFVFLLDTRTSANTLADVVGGKPVSVNGVAAADYAADASAESVGTFGVATSAPAVSEGFVTTPASLEINTTGEGATITAINLNPLVKYAVKYGTTLALEGGSAEIVLDDKFQKNASVTFSFEDANFFKLVVAE